MVLGLIAGLVIGAWLGDKHGTRARQQKVEAVIVAFNQLDRAHQASLVRRGRATGETDQIPMAPDWNPFVSAVNDLALALGGGPLRAKMKRHDAEVTFRQPSGGPGWGGI